MNTILFRKRNLIPVAAVLLAVAPVLRAADAGLLGAAKRGDIASVRVQLAAKANVNETTPDGTSALAYAAYRDDAEMAGMLLAGGADPNLANDYGITPLSLACTNRSTAIVGLLLKAKADPNRAQWAGETPLMTCAGNGSVEAVRLLLEAGADPNAAESENGQTALMWAVAAKQPAIVRLLIDKKANVNASSKVLSQPEPFIIPTNSVFGFNYPTTVHFPKSSGGFTPLMFAAQQDDMESAKMLLDAGARINEATQEDGSALIISAASGHEDLSIFLLERGADPTIKDGYGLTALHYSLHEGLLNIMGAKPTSTDKLGWTRKNMPKLMRALLAHGADPNAPVTSNWPTLDHPFLGRNTEDAPQIEPVGATPYLLAAASGDVSAMRILVEGRADPRATTSEGAPAWLIAAGIGFERGRNNEKSAIEALRLALEFAPDPKQAVNAAIDGDGRTPAHAASYQGWGEMLKYLAEQGANLDAKDKYGETPLTIALGDPEGRLYRNRAFGRYDERFRRPRTNQKIADLLVKLGATPFTGEVRDRSGE
jgi:ankyrin repeat protein